MEPSAFLKTTNPFKTNESDKDAPTILATLMNSTSKLFLFLGKALMQASETNWQNNSECLYNSI